MKTVEEICKPFGEDVRLEWDEVADFIRAAQADTLESAADEAEHRAAKLPQGQDRALYDLATYLRSLKPGER